MTSLVSSPRMITLEKQAQFSGLPSVVHHRLLLVETACKGQYFPYAGVLWVVGCQRRHMKRDQLSSPSLFWSHL